MKINPNLHSVLSEFLHSEYSEKECNELFLKCYSLEEDDFQKAIQVSLEFKNKKLANYFELELEQLKDNQSKLDVISFMKELEKLSFRRKWNIKSAINKRLQYLYPDYGFISQVHHLLVSDIYSLKLKEHECNEVKECITIVLNQLSGGDIREKLNQYSIDVCGDDFTGKFPEFS